jgi:hypothetical protein
MNLKTPEPLYRRIVPVEDRGKTFVSRYFQITPLRSHLGQPLHPVLVECNLRIDFAPDGGIYKVEWSNTPIKEKT